MRISVIGLGYVGLPTAVVLANVGHEVFGMEKNPNICKTINSGSIHFVERGLKTKVSKLVRSGRLSASSRLKEAEVYIICVPTPLVNSVKPDLSFIKEASLQIAQIIKKGDLVILESTSPIGTTEKITEWIGFKRKDLIMPIYESNQSSDINIAYCPERVLPGNLTHEIISNDRIVGGITKKCSKKAKSVYLSFSRGQILTTNSRLAEFCKLAENSYRDVNIAFANELSIIADQFEVNILDLINFANHHPRVNILQPGPGVGGHCIAVDPMFLVHSSKNKAKLIETSRIVNNSKPKFVVEKVKMRIKEINKTKKTIKVTIFGLAYKPDIDDLRESPAMIIAQKLSKIPKVYLEFVEPNIREMPEVLDGRLIGHGDYKSILKSDILLFLVNHKEFKSYKKKLNLQKVIDFCGAFN